MNDPSPPGVRPLIALCAAAKVSDDLPVQVVRADQTYAVFCIEGRYFVTQDACTHGPGSLAKVS